MKIERIFAREILDSRGLPTILTEVTVANGISAKASVPSGASTGRYEAHEKRDGDTRYFGKGVNKAVASVNGLIQNALTGINVLNQTAIDTRMLALDGTKSKESLGANAILSVSVACARCAAAVLGIPLYRYLGGIGAKHIPRVMMNVLNGGRHADNNLDIQEFMLAPGKGISAQDSIRMCAEIYRALKSLLKDKGFSTSVGDEGGFAPDLKSDEEALVLLHEASNTAGYRPGADVFFAVDMAASEWYQDGEYRLPKRNIKMDTEKLIEYVKSIVRAYPVISVEDPLHEDDYEGFAYLTREIGNDVMVVGDDLFVTNPERIMTGIEKQSANAILIKPNQIGTVTETAIAMEMGKSAGYLLIASHRSGDTADTFLADLACGLGADFMKSGAPARAERTEKYNRLMEIADDFRI